MSCGGTIASTPPDGGGPAAPRLGAAALVDSLPALADYGTVEARTFSTVVSAAMRLDDIVSLTRELTEWVDTAGPDVRGIVVTQGTDALEEIAFGVGLLWDRPVPVVFTAAMRHNGLPSPDGPANLLAAAATAVCPDARGIGVLVVIDDRIHLASTVRKAHTSDRGAFASPTVGPIGYLVEGEPRVVFHPAHRPSPLRIPQRSLSDHPVALVVTHLDDDGRLLEAVAGIGYSGVVIEAFGGGHLPPAIATSTALSSLIAQGPVVMASRTGAGETLRQTYQFVGSEIDLIDRGVLGAGRLTGPHARVLLTMLLAGGADAAEIATSVAIHGGSARP